jgi:hypothetical protein
VTVEGSFVFKSFEVSPNVGMVESRRTKDFNRLWQVAPRNQTAHGTLGDVPEQVGDFLETNQPVLLGGQYGGDVHKTSDSWLVAVWERFEKINTVPTLCMTQIVLYLPWLTLFHGWQYESKQSAACSQLRSIYDKLHRQHEEQEQ